MTAKMQLHGIHEVSSVESPGKDYEFCQLLGHFEILGFVLMEEMCTKASLEKIRAIGLRD